MLPSSGLERGGEGGFPGRRCGSSEDGSAAGEAGRNSHHPFLLVFLPRPFPEQ